MHLPDPVKPPGGSVLWSRRQGLPTQLWAPTIRGGRCDLPRVQDVTGVTRFDLRLGVRCGSRVVGGVQMSMTQQFDSGS